MRKRIKSGLQGFCQVVVMKTRSWVFGQIGLSLPQNTIQGLVKRRRRVGPLNYKPEEKAPHQVSHSVHKDKDKDKDNDKDKDKDKDADRITETLLVCYIFGILMTQAFQV